VTLEDPVVGAFGEMDGKKTAVSKENALENSELACLPCETEIWFPLPIPGSTLIETEESEVHKAARDEDADDILTRCDWSAWEYSPPKIVTENEPVVGPLLVVIVDANAGL